MKPFDVSGRFLAPSLSRDGELRRVTARSVGATVLSGGCGLAIQIIVTIVLARLVSPSEFGVVTMVTTFSLLFANFGLNGFTEAVVQREKVDNALVSNLFWINLGGGALLTIGFAAAGSLLARFYGDARVARVAVGMSATIFFTSTSVLHLALLKRAMRFSVVSANEILARACSMIVAIIMGSAGMGYWALVGGAVAQPLSTSIGAWYACRWIPSLPRRAAGTRSMVWFALNVYGRFNVNYFSRNMDNLLVGWRFNAQSLGFYKRAYDLFALSAGLLVSPLTGVVVSALSRLDPISVRYRGYLLNAMEVVAFAGMGLGAILTLVGNDLIRLLLGPGWEAAGRIFVFFGPGVGIMMLYYTHGWIHLSIGRADRWFRWGIIEFVVTGLLFLLGIRWGPSGVAMAWTGSFWILTMPGIWYAGRPIHFGIAPVLAAVWKYVLASLLAGGGAFAIIGRMPSLVSASGSRGAAARIVTTSLFVGILYLGAIVLLHRGFGRINRFARLLRDMVPTRSSALVSAKPVGQTNAQLSGADIA